jgi:DNA repair protein RadC
LAHQPLLPPRLADAKRPTVSDVIGLLPMACGGRQELMTPPPAPPVIRHVRDAAALLGHLVGDTVERAAVLYLDPEWRLLSRIDRIGSIATVVLPFRTVIAEALRLDAAALIIAHSHPSGSVTPSMADVAYTRELGRVAAAVELVLLDHLILAGREVTSLRALGLM